MKMTEIEVQENIVAHVASLLGLKASSIATDQPLHVLGLDSMGFVDLLVYIEKQFGLSLVNSGLSQENFASLAGLSQKIAKALPP